MEQRSRARGWALQALYAWETRGAPAEGGIRILHELFENLHVSPRNRPFAEVLLRLVAGNVARLDGIVQDALTNWRIGRLSVIDRCILRLGAAEMLFLDDIPRQVTIREYVRLAEKYGTPQSPRFVNGVLDAVASRPAPADATARR